LARSKDRYQKTDQKSSAKEETKGKNKDGTLMALGIRVSEWSEE
jgi:hypothetical protein